MPRRFSRSHVDWRVGQPFRAVAPIDGDGVLFSPPIDSNQRASTHIPHKSLRTFQEDYDRGRDLIVPYPTDIAACFDALTAHGILVVFASQRIAMDDVDSRKQEAFKTLDHVFGKHRTFLTETTARDLASYARIGHAGKDANRDKIALLDAVTKLSGCESVNKQDIHLVDDDTKICEAVSEAGYSRIEVGTRLSESKDTLRGLAELVLKLLPAPALQQLSDSTSFYFRQYLHAERIALQAKLEQADHALQATSTEANRRRADLEARQDPLQDTEQAELDVLNGLLAEDKLPKLSRDTSNLLGQLRGLSLEEQDQLPDLQRQFEGLQSDAQRIVKVDAQLQTLGQWLVDLLKQIANAFGAHFTLSAPGIIKQCASQMLFSSPAKPVVAPEPKPAAELLETEDMELDISDESDGESESESSGQSSGIDSDDDSLDLNQPTIR